MPYIHMLPDPGMNYTLNRPLLDGTSPARLKEIGAVAGRIKDYESWHAVWLELAMKRRSRKALGRCRILLPRGGVLSSCRGCPQQLYDDFPRNWARAMQGVAGYERIAVPYPGGHLPGFRLQAKGKERSTFIFNGDTIRSLRSSMHSYSR